MDRLIQTTKEYNDEQMILYAEYCRKCRENNLTPEKFNYYFTSFPQKGYVLTGKYPIFKRTKKEIYQLTK